jgi:hypothetical protein
MEKQDTRMSALGNGPRKGRRVKGNETVAAEVDLEAVDVGGLVGFAVALQGKAKLLIDVP